MIQAVNSVNSNYTTSKAPSFAQGQPQMHQRPNKAASAARWTATQFVSGALISVLIDGFMNGLAKIKKTPEKMMPLKEMGKRAAVWGGLWVGMSVVLNVVMSAFARKNQNK